MGFSIVSLAPADQSWVGAFLHEQWGADIVVSRGKIFRPDTLPGFFAVTPDGTCVGLLTYHIEGGECEVVTIDSITSGQGIGTALMARRRSERQRKQDAAVSGSLPQTTI